MKKPILFICILASISGMAQVMPSPDASSMIKGMNTPVNLYDGVASFGVPIYEATANNGAQVPVGLQYATGGIKVNEIAGVAGLGWNLQAGGSITRVVRSEPDEQKPYVDQLNYTKVKSYLDNQKKYDFEKDLFFFSFPGGGGRFIFSGDFNSWAMERIADESYSQCLDDLYECEDRCQESGSSSCGCGTCQKKTRLQLNGGNLSYSQFVTLPTSDIKVQFNYSSELNSSWVITDTYGTKYFFGQTTGSRETTTTNYKDNKDNPTYDTENESQFVSTWHLDRIVYANQPETADITFTYVSATITEEQEDLSAPLYGDYYNCIIGTSVDSERSACDAYGSPNVINTFKSTIGTKYISSIKFPKGKIKFDYNNSRSDLPGGKSLYNISLLDHYNRVVSETRLGLGYFNSSDSYFKGGTYGGCGRPECYRLRLDRIERDGALMYEFDYTNDENTSGIDLFELPPRDSWYTDHWGFYNGGPHQGELYLFHAEMIFGPGFTHVPGIGKEPSIYARANLLSKIKLPTGGYRKFEFGKHPSSVDFWGIDSGHGGVRVESIKDYDENNNVISHIKYDYFDAISAPSPQYTYVVQAGNGQALHGKSIAHIFDLNGPGAGYGEVMETNVKTGFKTRHYFKSLTEQPPNEAIKKLYVLNVENKTWTLDDPQPEYFFSRPVTNSLEFYDRGTEKKTISFDAAGKKTQEVDYYYSHEEEEDFGVVNNGFHFTKSDATSVDYTVSSYNIATRNVFLDSTVTKVFDESNSLVTETTTSYIYHPTYQTLPREVKTEKTDGGGEAFNSKVTNYYAEFPSHISSMASEQLYNIFSFKNIIATPLVSETRVQYPGQNNYKLTEVQATTYNLFNDLLMPEKVYGLVKQNPSTSYGVNDLELKVTTTYNSEGLLASQLGQDGIPTLYTYDDYGYQETVTIDPGVEALKRSTTYNYKPLIGINYVISPNGRKTSYKYDNRNRLLMVIDNEGNILKRYRYHNVSDEQLALSSYISYSGFNTSCSLLTFTSNDASTYYGKTEYSWNFGDGSVAEECTFGNRGSSGKSVTHRYATPGNYTVTLTMTNPDYDEAHVRTYPITIYSGTATLSLNGTTEVQNCSSSADSGGEQLEQPLDGGGGSTGSAPSTWFSLTFGNDGAKCTSNVLYKFEYQKQDGSWSLFGNNSYANLPDEAFYYSGASYQINIRGTVTDCTGVTQQKFHTLIVNPCNSSTGGGTDDGGTGNGDEPIDDVIGGGSEFDQSGNN